MGVGGLSAPPGVVKVPVLGIAISRVNYDTAIASILSWAGRHESRTVSALAVHGVMTGVLDREHGERLNGFDMLTPDGQPVRWVMNWLGGAGLRHRVRGAELTKRLSAAAARAGVGVYLYGSRPEVVTALAVRLRSLFPALAVVGIRPSRFREATPEEDADDVNAINRSGAGIVFVGLGCPRQERWAAAHQGRVKAVMVCVGAAFDFHADMMPEAPQWMQRLGLEWVFRLGLEPRRLWRRYLLLNPLYILLVVFSWLRLWRPRVAPA